MYDPRTIYIPPGYGKITFGRVEMKNILMAVGALTLAFTIFFLDPFTRSYDITLESVLFALGISFVAVITGFMLHEFAHKVVAQRSGAWAEFRAYPLGLLMAVVVSLMGFIFAAPGAVYIQGMISKKQNGLISIAGPLTNLGLGAAFIGLAMISSGALLTAFVWLGLINVFMGAFNMIPIPPFDGYKVLKWNVPAYIATVAVAAVLFILVYF